MPFEAPSSFALLSAAKAQLLYRPNSEAAHRLADDLLALTLDAEEAHKPRRRRRRADDLESLRDTIGALIHDLLKAQTRTAAQGFVFVVQQAVQFTATVAAFRQYFVVRDAWRALDLIDYVPGISHGRSSFDDEDGPRQWDGTKRSRKAPRLRATARLLGIAEGHGIAPRTLKVHFRRSFPASYPITVNFKPVRNRTPEADAIAAQVRGLNQFLDGHAFEPPITPYFVGRFRDPDTKRAELVEGGRLYSVGDGDTDPSEGSVPSFQRWAPADRLRLKIDGEAVVEIDIRASYLTIYLAAQGVHVPLDRDPYQVPGLDRILVKHLVSAFFGEACKHPKDCLDLERWPRLKTDKPRDQEVREARRGHKVKPVVARILTAIPALRALPDTGVNAGTLEKTEAGIILDVLTDLRITEGIAALPMHDAIIVQERHVDRAASALASRFCAVVGVVPGLKIERDSSAPVAWTSKAAHQDTPSGQG